MTTRTYNGLPKENSSTGHFYDHRRHQLQGMGIKTGHLANQMGQINVPSMKPSIPGITRKQVVDEAQANIDKLQSEWESMHKQHEDNPEFRREHIEEHDRAVKERVIERDLVRIQAKAYEGNFETRDNWNYGKIPESFKIPDNYEDRDALRQAIKDLYEEKNKIVENSPEYQELDKERQKVAWPKFSKEHREFDEKMDRITSDIDRYKRRIQEVSTQSGIVEYAKNMKENKLRNAEWEIKKAKIASFKEAIKKGIKDFRGSGERPEEEFSPDFGPLDPGQLFE